MARVLAVMPHEHFAAMYLRGPVAEAIAARPELQWSFATRQDDDADRVAALGAAAGRWVPLQRPFRTPRPASSFAALRWLPGQLASALGFYVHLALVYRFNARHGFAGFRNRLRLSPHLKRLAWKEGHPVHRWLGWPFPRRAAVERLLLRAYHARWQRRSEVERLFDDLRPDVLYLATVQSPFVTPYVLAARARGVPVVGAIGSWDQPATKGPVVPGVDRYVAPSRWAAEQMVALHGLASERIETIGWVQMDAHHAWRDEVDRAEFLESIGADPESRLLVFGAYTERLGSHEPPIIRWLAERVASGALGPKVTLVVRPHPADVDWQARFADLADPPHVLVQTNGHGGARHLAHLMRHADVVMSSAGSLCLDAVANGTSAVGIAFSDRDLPYYDRPERLFEMEHYASVVATGGVPLARSRDELESLLVGYLDDPGRGAEARAALRELQLEPLDGRAGERMVAAVAEVAGA